MDPMGYGYFYFHRALFLPKTGQYLVATWNGTDCLCAVCCTLKVPFGNHLWWLSCKNWHWHVGIISHDLVFFSVDQWPYGSSFFLRCFIVVLFDIPNVWNTPYNVSIVVDLIGVYPEFPHHKIRSRWSFMWFHSMISMGFRNSTKAPSMCELFFIILLNGQFHDLQGFIRPRWLFGISEPSTVTLARNLPFRAF